MIILLNYFAFLIQFCVIKFLLMEFRFGNSESKNASTVTLTICYTTNGRSSRQCIVGYSAVFFVVYSTFQ